MTYENIKTKIKKKKLKFEIKKNFDLLFISSFFVSFLLRDEMNSVKNKREKYV